MQRKWQAGRFVLDLGRPQIMGIVNITPDSFSDGGTYSAHLKTTLAHAEKLLRDGANILDVGGESTRPGADFVSPEEEWKRVEPVLRELVQWNVPLSLDTRRAAIMRLALEANLVDIINDVQGLEDEGALDVLQQFSDTGICLMHMQGLPENMQISPDYQDVVREVSAYLQQRVEACLNLGMDATRLVLDPGFGFGKTLAHNVALMQHLDDLRSIYDLPILIGVSRKRMIGEILGRDDPRERVDGSVAAALFAATKGAQIVRVHDVKETADALKVWQALSA